MTHGRNGLSGRHGSPLLPPMMEIVDRVGVRMRRSFAVQMRMFRREFRMSMQNNVGIGRRPKRAREQDAAERDPGRTSKVGTIPTDEPNQPPNKSANTVRAGARIARQTPQAMVA